MVHWRRGGKGQNRGCKAPTQPVLSFPYSFVCPFEKYRIHHHCSMLLLVHRDRRTMKIQEHVMETKNVLKFFIQCCVMSSNPF